MKILCNYCQEPATLVTGAKLYPLRHDLRRLKFWYCDNGHDAAYVGCHKKHKAFSPKGETPLGILANAELRAAKNQAHRHFDPLWRDGAFINRGIAYAWLAVQLRIPRKETHIGMFDVAMCERVVAVCSEKQRAITCEDFD